MDLNQHLQGLPRRLRLVLGAVLILLGIPLYILPVPLGIFFLASGGVLLLNASPALRRRVRRASERISVLRRRTSNP